MAEASTPNPYALQMKALEDLKSAQEQDEMAQKDFQKQRAMAGLFNNVGQAFSRTSPTQAEIMAKVSPVDRSQGYAQNAMKPWDQMSQDQADSSKNLLNKYKIIQEQANVLRDQQSADLASKKYALDAQKEDTKTAWEQGKPERDLANAKALKQFEAGLDAKKTKEIEKKPTSAQFTAATFAKRMEDAEGIFDNLASKGYDRTSRMEDLRSKLPGELHSSELRSQSQAERNFVNAVLRRESGSAIQPSEFSSATLQYFPRPGDDQDVLAQKRQNRVTAIAGLKAEAANASGKLEEQLALQPKANPTKAQQPSNTAIAAPNYIRRVAPNGRVVLYDQNKKPIGYEDEMGK